MASSRQIEGDSNSSQQGLLWIDFHLSRWIRLLSEKVCPIQCQAVLACSSTDKFVTHNGYKSLHV